MASTQVNLYEAKTQLSSLVDRASKGEEIIIAKAGKPLARLTCVDQQPMRPAHWPLKQFSKQALRRPPLEVPTVQTPTIVGRPASSISCTFDPVP